MTPALYFRRLEYTRWFVFHFEVARRLCYGLALSWNVIMVNASSEPLRKRRPLQARDVLFLTAVAVAFALLYAGRSLAPWLHFTGGSFHVLPWWSGAGSFAGPDGTYQLYLYLTPLDTRSHPTIRTALTGNGQLCTPSGERLVLHVSADMDKQSTMEHARQIHRHQQLRPQHAWNLQRDDGAWFCLRET